eukprot:m.66200 g.66200  ORF g.66200 m.66200 type:complete len:182 (-) comp16546_c0_seq4:43-588(-)
MGEFILWLLPGAPLQDQAEQAKQNLWDQIGPCEGLLYPPHCTVTGFFTCTASVLQSVCEAVPKILEQLRSQHQALQPKVHGLILNPAFSGVDMASPGMALLAQRLQSAVAEQLSLRPKRCDHMSLVYGHSSEHQALVQKVLRDTIKDFQCEWRLALLQRLQPGNLSDARRHEFLVREEWRL